MKLAYKLTLAVLLFGVGPVHAQFFPDPVALISTPEAPSPGENFRVEANTPTFDKNSAEFIWMVDGRPRPDLSGQAKNSITIKAGSLGTVHRFTVEVYPAAGSGGTASLNVSVADLSLTWFAETFIPRWYQGKALPSQNSVVNIVAIPEFVVNRTISPENLIYRWSLDDEDNVLNGPGERVFRIKISDLPKTSHRIRVEVEDFQGTIRKERGLLLTSFTPRLGIYSYSPLGGIEPRISLTSFSVFTRGLLDLTIEPFFFPVGARRDLAFRWVVNGVSINGEPENPHILTLDTEDRAAGEIQISATADDKDYLIPSASRLMRLILQ